MNNKEERIERLLKKKWELSTRQMLFFVLALLLIFLFIGIINAIFYSPSAEFDIALYTGMLATFTALSITYSIASNAKREDKDITLKRLEEFYSPLIKIFSAYPESVMHNMKEVEYRANELVSILKGKRYLATLDTMPSIPENVEHIAYFNWINEPQTLLTIGGGKTSTGLGYLVFKDDNERKPWCRFVKQLWKDYDFLVKKYYSSELEQDKEPKWQLRVKDVPAKGADEDEASNVQDEKARK